MSSFGRLQLLLLISSRTGFPPSKLEKVEHLESLASYTVSLIEHLASKQIGTFDCCLYHVCDDPPGSSILLQEIYIQLERSTTTTIPRLAIDSRFPWRANASSWLRPSIVIIHVEITSRRNRKALNNAATFLSLLDRQTKIVVLLSTRSRIVTVLTFESPITTGKLFNVVFLSTDEQLMMFPDIRAEKFARFWKLWPVEKMFPDQGRYLHGRQLRYGIFEGYLNNCVENDCEGYEVIIVETMANYLNTTARYERFVCPYKFDKRKESASECVFKAMLDPDCRYDIFADPTVGIANMEHYLENPILNNLLLLAPRGRSLTIAELFLRPFQTELWILFFVLMVSLKLLSILIPSSCRNDPILLPICGFERYSLNQADPKEKLLMLSLIVLFFFVSNAYETKIISLMSNKPRVTQVTTIQDILDSGTRVKTGYITATAYPQFKSLYIYFRKSPDQLDGTSVYMFNGASGQQLIQRKINWDYESNQPRYRILDEIIVMSVSFYHLPIRSALKPHLQFVLRSLFESGLLMKWRHEWFSKADFKFSAQTLPGGVNPTADILQFSDLLPAWFVVLVGLSISFGIFVWEISCFKLYEGFQWFLSVCKIIANKYSKKQKVKPRK